MIYVIKLIKGLSVKFWRNHKDELCNFLNKKKKLRPQKPDMTEEENGGEFYLRYYVGHKGKFGHEFLEFEFRPDGKLRYANNSNYKNDTMIRKEVFLTPSVLKECRRIVCDSDVIFHFSAQFSFVRVLVMY